jgi:PHP family Zn ribbon phosphoesterase
MELEQWRGSLLAETLEKARDQRERNRPCGVRINNGLIERVEELAGERSEGVGFSN